LKKHRSCQKDYSLAIFSRTRSFICSSSCKKDFFHISYSITQRQEPPEQQSAQQGGIAQTTTKFRSLVAKGKIDIDNITPKFIKSIRTKDGWENRTATNFRQNYQRVANTLQLAQDLNGACVEQRGESFRVFFFFWHIL
jgi:hypothetical protein